MKDVDRFGLKHGLSLTSSICLALLIVLLISIIGFQLLLSDDVQEADASDSEGKCGDNLSYRYYEGSKKLVISGSGPMYNYDRNFVPWYSYRSSISQIVLNEGITNIGDEAFYGLSNIKEVIFPNSLTRINGAAFAECKSLEYIIIPDHITSIGNSCFAGCSSLKAVYLGDGITVINMFVFHSCSSLETVILGKNVNAIGAYCFEGCGSLRFINIPFTVNAIETFAFRGTKMIEDGSEVGAYAPNLAGKTWHGNGGGSLTHNTGEYSATFDSNGGLFCSFEYRLTYNQKISSFPTATWSITVPASSTPYVLEGWYTSPTGGTKVTSSYVFTEDMRLYAHWQRAEYDITLNSNGGSCSFSSLKTVDGTIKELPTPTRDGYSFDGWYTSAEGGDKISAPKTFFKSQTLFAHWTFTNYHTIKFNANGGSPDVISIRTGEDGKLVSQPPVPTKRGYVFNQWYTDKSGGESVGLSGTFDRDQTLYAHWMIVQVHFIGGSFYRAASVDPDTCTIKQWPADPVKEGYKFAGWFDEQEGGKEYESDFIFTQTVYLYAHWIREFKNTVTFDSKGGSPEKIVVETNTDGLLDSLPPEPVREGFVFAGWYSDPNRGSPIDMTLVYNVDYVVYYAHWNKIPTYQITFNSNGGSTSNTSMMTGTDGKLTALPEDPVRTNYSFAGWFTSRYDGEGSQISLSTVYSKDTVVFAHWTSLITYTVTFNSNGGTPSSTTLKTGTDGKLSSLPDEPIRSNYTFAGWFNSKENGYGLQITSSTVFSKDTTVYAHWTSIPIYTVTFNSNGGTPSSTTLKTGTDGKLSSLPDEPIRSNYTFAGWFTSASSGTQISSSTVFSKDTTVYAHWTSIPIYTVTFNSNGGTPSSFTLKTGTDGKLSSLPNDPTRPDYSFAGWFTSSSGGTQISSSTVFTKDTTVYAHWISSPTYTVTFDSNMGLCDVSSLTTQNGKLTSLPSANRDGYKFDGWFNERTGGSKITTSSVYTGDTKVWAHWTRTTNQPIVTFNSLDGSCDVKEIVTVNNRLNSLPVATADGKQFNGWYSSKTGGEKITTSTIFNQDETVYVHWYEEYSINLDANGGICQSSSVTTVGQKLPSVPDPIRDGYTFKGWFTSRSGYEVIDSDYVFTKSCTIYAIWVKESTITFEPEGGTIPLKTMKTVNQKLTDLPTPERDRYRFQGWFYSISGGDCVDLDEVYDRDTTLYAQWVPMGQMYFVYFDVDGGSKSAPEIMHLVEAEKYTLPSYSGSKSGFIFSGWVLDERTYSVGEQQFMTNKDITYKALWVVGTHVSNVSVSESSKTIDSGKSFKLTITISPSDASIKDVIWSSSDESIVKVDAKGNVTAVGTGTATITVSTVDGGKTASCKVTVGGDVKVTGVTLSKTSISISEGGTYDLQAIVSPTNATDKTVTWRSSNIGCITVEDGKVKAIKEGTASITVTTNDGGMTATCTVKVEKAGGSIKLDKNSFSISNGEIDKLTATVSGVDDPIITWTSSNEGIVSVDSDGNLKARSPGMAIITASIGSAEAKSTVKVLPNILTFATTVENGITKFDDVESYIGMIDSMVADGLPPTLKVMAKGTDKVAIDGSVISKLGSIEGSELSVEINGFEAKFPAKMLAQYDGYSDLTVDMMKTSIPSRFSNLKAAVVLEVNMDIGGVKVKNNFSAPVTISVQYQCATGQNRLNANVYYLSESGSAIAQGCSVSWVNGVATLAFNAEHFSTYAFVFEDSNGNSFVPSGGMVLPDGSIDSSGSGGSGGMDFTMIAVAGAAVLALVAIVGVMMYRRK